MGDCACEVCSDGGQDRRRNGDSRGAVLKGEEGGDGRRAEIGGTDG